MTAMEAEEEEEPEEEEHACVGCSSDDLADGKKHCAACLEKLGKELPSYRRCDVCGEAPCYETLTCEMCNAPYCSPRCKRDDLNRRCPVCYGWHEPQRCPKISAEDLALRPEKDRVKCIGGHNDFCPKFILDAQDDVDRLFSRNPYRVTWEGQTWHPLPKGIPGPYPSNYCASGLAPHWTELLKAWNRIGAFGGRKKPLVGAFVREGDAARIMAMRFSQFQNDAMEEGWKGDSKIDLSKYEEDGKKKPEE